MKAKAKTRAYYNEHNKAKAAWLREGIAQGVIAHGEVDERSIEDVTPADLAGFTQCHFFAGIGGWSIALRLAGWRDWWDIWTASLPCQPFSAAGKGDGFADERHLWPAYFHLFAHGKPKAVPAVGEQVASKDGLAWLDVVSADMERAGHAVGTVDSCSAGFGAPHIRQRLYWVADPMSARRSERRSRTRSGQVAGGGCVERLADACGPRAGGDAGATPGQETSVQGPGNSDGGLSGDAPLAGRAVRGMADATGPHHRSQAKAANHWEPEALRSSDWSGGCCCSPGRLADSARQQHDGPGRGRKGWRAEHPNSSASCGLADPAGCGRGEECQDRGRFIEGDSAQRLPTGPSAGCCDMRPSQVNGLWRAADWLFCRDGFWRPVEPGTFPLAYGLPRSFRRLQPVLLRLAEMAGLDAKSLARAKANRVVRLHGYGDAINVEQAAEFVRAYMMERDLPLLDGAGEGL